MGDSVQSTRDAAPHAGQRTASTWLGVIFCMVEQDRTDIGQGLFNLDHI
jgi:hypothetical protein